MITPNENRVDYYMHIPELLQRHKNAKPPTQSYCFIPTEDDMIVYNEKKPFKSYRRIYEMKYISFKQFEIDKLKELEEEIIKHNAITTDQSLKIIFPDDYNPIEKSRYLQATSYDISKTIKLIGQNISWRHKLIPPKVSDKVIELLNCGFMYIHGRDRSFRPIIVIQASCYMKLKDKYSFENWVNTLIFSMEYVIGNLLVPGQIENWNLITDLSGVSLIFMPSELKKIIGILQSNYRCRLYVNYLLGMSTILKGIWKFVKSFLDEITVKKIRFVDSKNHDDMFTYINKNQIEKKFGGLSENLTPGGNNLFPPNFPPIDPENGLYEEGKSLGKLVSEEEYKVMYREDKLKVVGEYYLEKWRVEEMERQQKEQKEKEEILRQQKVEDERIKREYKNKLKFLDINDFFSEKEGVEAINREQQGKIMSSCISGFKSDNLSSRKNMMKKLIKNNINDCSPAFSMINTPNTGLRSISEMPVSLTGKENEVNMGNTDENDNISSVITKARCGKSHKYANSSSNPYPNENESVSITPGSSKRNMTEFQSESAPENSQCSRGCIII